MLGSVVYFVSTSNDQPSHRRSVTCHDMYVNYFVSAAGLVQNIYGSVQFILLVLACLTSWQRQRHSLKSIISFRLYVWFRLFLFYVLLFYLFSVSLFSVFCFSPLSRRAMICRKPMDAVMFASTFIIRFPSHTNVLSLCWVRCTFMLRFIRTFILF